MMLPALPTPEVLDKVGDQDKAAFIIASVEGAKSLLAACLEGNYIEAIIETKAQAEAIGVYAKQKQLGEDAVLAATEIVRRAERCMGLAIHKGQEAGTIAKSGSIGCRGGRGIHGANPGSVRGQHLDRVTKFIPDDHARVDAYAMARAPETDFEDAISSAKAEGNLSRSNVVKKVNVGIPAAGRWEALPDLAAAGHSSRQIATQLGTSDEVVRRKARALSIDIPADRVMGRTRRVNHNRVLREFALSLESLAPSCDLIEFGAIDRTVLKESLTVMDEALKPINRMRRQLKGYLDGNED